MAFYARSPWVIAALALAGGGFASSAWAQISTTYSYDPHGQVTTVVRSSGTVGYTYDAAGNRVQLTASTGAGALAAKTDALAATKSDATVAADDPAAAHDAAVAEVKAQVARLLGPPAAQVPAAPARKQ